MVTSRKILGELLNQLDTQSKSINSLRAFIGFDGFIDKIQKAVGKKEAQRNSYLETIQKFTDHLLELPGRNGQVELVTEQVKMGGNAPILSNALATLGVNSYCMGAMGLPQVHPVFNAMHTSCKLISVAEPGESQAIEFNDGKIILSEVSMLGEHNWEYIRKNFDLKKVRSHVDQCHLVAFVGWSRLWHSSDIWQGFREDVIMPLGRKDLLFFFDLCDLSQRTACEIREILEIISSFSTYGKVTLGLNEDEACKAWAAIKNYEINSETNRNDIPSVEEIGAAIYHAMDVDSITVHLVDRMMVFRNNYKLEINGRLVTHPKVQTGGGNNLNAGYCLGLLLGLDTPLSMMLGMATSGAYVENGYSPEMSDLTRYIRNWISELSESEEGQDPDESNTSERLSVQKMLDRYYELK